MRDQPGKGRGRRLLARVGRAEPDAGTQGWHKTPWLWVRGDGQEAARRPAVAAPGMRQDSRGVAFNRGGKVADSTQGNSREAGKLHGRTSEQ